MRHKLPLLAALAALSIVTVAPAAAQAGGYLIASPAACPGQNRLRAPASSQETTMRCMIDFARTRAGLGGLTDVTALDESARDKGQDILSCDSFSHYACEREFTYWMQQSGYLSTPYWHVGENLAWGVGREGTVRSLFRALMGSPLHRANVLGSYRELGLSMRIGTLEGVPRVHVWTEHFGTQVNETS
jgi:uncharacterized protein YkwD